MPDLRRIDLNLLVAFDALMRTRHVTRAADLMGLGQPGMSAALARLRATFADELLVKQGSEMLPTARAVMLEPEVRRVLRDIDRLVGEGAVFEPTTAKRVFQVRMSDLLSYLLLPSLIARLRAEAPGLALEVVHLDPSQTTDALEKNAIDLAVSTQLDQPSSIDASVLFADRVVGVMRADHPACGKTTSLDDFIELPQLKVAQSPIDHRFADQQLARLGRRRKIAATVPHWLAVPEILSRSDLIAIVPASLAGRLAASAGLTTFDPPLPDKSFNWSMYWHRRQGADQGLGWLRGRLFAVIDEQALA